MRSHPDLSNIGTQCCKEIRVRSYSPSPSQNDCCNSKQSVGKDQTGKARDGHAPGNSVFGENHGIINELNCEKIRCSFDKKMHVVEQSILAHVKLQCHGWQLAFDSRLHALEEHARKNAPKAKWVEDRFSAVEDCTSSLIQLFALKHQQSIDLNDELAKIKTIVFDLERNLGRNSLEAVHPFNVEHKSQSNKLTKIPEDGDPLVHERVDSCASAHKQARLRQQEPDPKQELANFKGSFANRLCVVECNVDQLSSILKNIETRVSSMNGQVSTSNRRGTIHRMSNQKSSDSSTMTFSGGAFESSVSPHKRDAVSLVCNHHSALSKDSIHVSERHPVSTGITDCPQEGDANTQVHHVHSQMQLMLAKARRCLEQVAPFNENHLSQKSSTVVEESDTEA